jgi:hypothetical protein
MSLFVPRSCSRLLAVLVTATLTFPAPVAAAKKCPKVPAAAAKLRAEGGKLAKAKKFLAAAQRYESAAEAAAVCRPRQMTYVEDALDAYQSAASAGGFDRTKCEEDPDLAATRMLVRQRVALTAKSDAPDQLQEIDRLLQARDPTTRAASDILEGVRTPAARTDMDLGPARDDYSAAAARFPACAPDLREHLLATTLATIAAPTTTPSCAGPDERARHELGLVLDVVAATEPAATSPNLDLVKARRDDARRLGVAVETSQATAASAAAAGDHVQAHAAHAQVLQALPECPVYHQARTDALGGAVAALQQLGTPKARTDAIQLLDRTLREWRVAYGAAVGPDHAYYEARRVALTNDHAAYLAEVERQRPAPTPPKPSRRAKKAKAKPKSKLVASQPAPLTTNLKDASRGTGNIVGVGVSGGLTVAFGLAATVLSARLRWKGPLHRDIVDAYITAGYNPYTTADLCDAATYGGADAGIADACAHHTTVRHTAVAMWSLMAASAISTIVMTTVMMTAHKRQAARRVSFGVAPQRTGALLTGALRF